MSNYNNVINFSFINHIIKKYVPEIQNCKQINMNLFREAMIHTSQQNNNYKTYERLEYLGDAVFHAIITEYIYKRYYEEQEGFLTKLRIKIERGDSMVELSKILKLDSYVQLENVEVNDHILEDIFEGFVGAFYLNFGITHTKTFIVKIIELYKDFAELIYYDDNYKDLLLRYFHQIKWGHPKYIEENKYENKFVSIVKNPKGKILGKGIGKSKKKAEQNASKNALIALKIITDNEIDTDWLEKIEKDNEIEKEKEDKKDKKMLSIYNPLNKLIKLSDIKKIFELYKLQVPKITVNISLMKEAMTHRSYIKRKKMPREISKPLKGTVPLQPKSNERLQFLGDAILHLIIGEYLYHKYPDAEEGFLTRLRCKLENRESLYYLAKKTSIGLFVLVSQHIELLHGRDNINIISGGFEAFIGVLYLELGLDFTAYFIKEVIKNEFNINKIAESETNYKDVILQIYNKNHWGQPIYKLLNESGPDHCKKFTMGIFLKKNLMGLGTATSKKKAEQIASKEMYNQIINIF